MQPGSMVRLVTPDNPRLDGAAAKIEAITEWGAFVKTDKAATGEFRALFSEMVPYSQVNGHHRAAAKTASIVPQIIQMGYTGNVCTLCGSFRMVRSGACEKCDDCGTSSGCS